ncbi:MAG: hypothetical protein QOG08_1200, partial [Chloroflexota bacterium]|nr:hypothetical protein [Chloroflexota bacterium]
MVGNGTGTGGMVGAGGGGAGSGVVEVAGAAVCHADGPDGPAGLGSGIRGSASYDTAVGRGVSSGGGTYDVCAGETGAAAGAAASPCGRKGVIGGTSRPPARVASSACDAFIRSGESSAAAISRSAPWARSAAGPMAPLAIDRIVTTRPGGMFGGAGAPAGSTPKAAQIAIPLE